MKEFIKGFGTAMVKLNQNVPGHEHAGNNYKPGIGPYGEDNIVDMVMDYLTNNNLVNEDYIIRPNKDQKTILGLQNYKGISGRAATPDLVIGNKIIEFKIARPLRDNGEPEDTWFKKVFDPHPSSYSTFIDVAKLCKFKEQHDAENQFEKWVMVIGFERLDESVYKLDALFPGLFRYISENISQKAVLEDIGMTFELGERHPVHQVAKLYGFRY
jgi:hypothetical protein